MKRVKLFLSMLVAAMLLPMAVRAGEEGKTYTSTFVDASDYQIYSSMKIVRMKTKENVDWYAFLYDVNATVQPTLYGSKSETCLKIQKSSGNLVLSSMLALEGSIEKVILCMGGKFEGVLCEVSESSQTADQNSGMKNSSESEDLQIIEFNFDGSRGYNSASVQMTIMTEDPVYVRSITVIQGEAEGKPMSGKTGDLTWKVEELPSTITVTENGVRTPKPQYRLTISGEGYMPDYQTGYDETKKETIYYTPWYPYETITSLVVDEGVKSIGNYALCKSNYLDQVKLPSTLEKIGYYAFTWTPITSINFPEGLTKIDEYAFGWCGHLKNVNLPSTLTSLSVESIKCNSIEKLTIAEGNPKYDSRNNCNGIIETAKNMLFMGTPATVIPASVTSIGYYAYGNNYYLYSFVIPNHVTSIGMKAFAACYNLKSLVIGSGMTSIARKAFSECRNLEDVYCYANPADLTWEEYDDAGDFIADKATKFHVKAADLEAWQTKFPDINATFVGDLEESGLVNGGDVDGDGEVTAEDVASIANVIAGLITDENIKAAADVNGDSKVDVADIVALVNKFLGK